MQIDIEYLRQDDVILFNSVRDHFTTDSLQHRVITLNSVVITAQKVMWTHAHTYVLYCTVRHFR